MPSVARNKTTHLDVRITAELRQQLRRVAEIQGRSVSDYVTATLRSAVQRDIAQMEVIQLSHEASDHFAAMLIKPPDLASAMQRAFEHHRRLVEPA
jgi:uncharacterized protein (DUF1778 family)